MWPDLIQKAKEGGLDVIQTYVFWNGHEPSPGQVMASFSLSHNYVISAKFYVVMVFTDSSHLF